MNIRVKNGVCVLLTNTLDYWQLLPKLLTREKRGKQVCACLSCSAPQLNAPQGHPVRAAVYSQIYSTEWEACVTVAYCLTAWAATHHFRRIKSPFLEGGCCYTESLSRLNTVPTSLCSKQRRLNVALVFWLVSVCCDSPWQSSSRYLLSQTYMFVLCEGGACLYPFRKTHTSALFQVKPVSYLMLNLDTALRTSGTPLSAIPVGATLQFSVSYHDDIGETFYAANIQLGIRCSRWIVTVCWHLSSVVVVYVTALNVSQSVCVLPLSLTVGMNQSVCYLCVTLRLYHLCVQFWCKWTVIHIFLNWTMLAWEGVGL